MVVGDAVGVEDLNAETGALIWSYRTPTTSQIVPPGPSEVISSPAISDPAGQEVVAFGDLGGASRVLSLATGAQVYEHTTASWISGSPAVSGGDILGGSSDGFLYDFSAGAGNDSPVTSITSPAFRSAGASPGGDLTVLGTASDSAGVAAVVTAVRQGGTGGKWWDADTSSWSATPVAETATLAASGGTSTGWSVSFPVPTSGDAYRVDAYNVSVAGPTAVPAADDEFFVSPEPSGPSLSVSLDFAGPGGSVSIMGAGFGPKEKVTVALAGIAVGHATSLADGSLRAFKVTIPGTADFGPAALVATGATSKKAAAAGIFVSNQWPQLGDGSGRTGYEANDPVITQTVDPGQNVLLYPAWQFSAGAAMTSPAVSDQVVYVGDRAGTVHAVQAYDGTQLWSWRTPDGSAISGSPAVDATAHLVFVGATDGKLYAVSTSGKLSWSARIGSGDVEAPLLAGTRVYAVSTGGRVATMSAVAGSRVWSTTLARISGAPALGIGSADDRLYAINASTGAEFAAYPVGASATGVAIAGDAVLVTTSSWLVESVRTYGSFVWTYATDGRLLGPPALVGGTFYAAGRGGILWAFTPYAAPPR